MINVNTRHDNYFLDSSYLHDFLIILIRRFLILLVPDDEGNNSVYDSIEKHIIETKMFARD